MEKMQDKDTRYYLEIERESLRIVGVGYDQKDALDKGRQPDPDLHRLFVTKGQYSKFLNRCSSQLASVREA